MALRKTVIFRGRASLVDRLVDLNPKVRREPQPLRTRTWKQFRESVRRDLSWLLNTRTPISGPEFDRRDLTTIDFGIPDFGTYFTASGPDREILIQRMVRAISFFEPRLENVRVTLDPVQTSEKSLRIVIDAEMAVEQMRIPVSFLTVFQGQSATMEIHENRRG